MDSDTDDRDTGLPPVGSTEELEEALKWLEELTARQGKPADHLSNPVPAASLDSPFRGLIDGEEGDLPDWLREVPQTSNPEKFGEGETESRLDWLAKMAQRESIEELPTLEWRRLSEPVQSSILSFHQEASLKESGLDLSSESDEVEGITEGVEAVVVSVGSDDPMQPLIPVDASPIEETEVIPNGLHEEIAEEPAIDTVDESGSQSFEDLSAAFVLEADEELPPMDDLDAAMAWIEELAASQDAPIEDIPSVADRALASKLMMEAGLIPDVSPLDELGSDSSLVEGRTPTHPFIEEEDFADTVVLVETMAADQGMALEMPDVAPILGDEIDINRENDLSNLTPFEESALPPASFDQIEVTPVEAPLEESSFDEAMAFLDEMAIVQATERVLSENIPLDDERVGEVELPADADSLQEADSVLEQQLDGFSKEDESEEVIEALGMEPLSPIDSAWQESSNSPIPVVTGLIIEETLSEDNQEMEIESPATELMDTAAEPQFATEPAINEGLATDGIEQGALEAALLALDAMALPPGKTLDEINATLRTARVEPLRDVTSALDWLESALTQVVPATPASALELGEKSLIDQMPEDPDAVLAWLEQMAGEEADPVIAPIASQEDSDIFVTSAARAEPLLEEVVEADLLNMPEDPDEAMVWLEGLARGGHKTLEPQGPMVPEPAETALPLTTIPAAEQVVHEAPVEIETENIGNKRRRATRAAQKAKPETSESPPPPTPAKEQPSSAWVDLLKPLD